MLKLVPPGLFLARPLLLEPSCCRFHQRLGASQAAGSWWTIFLLPLPQAWLDTGIRFSGPLFVHLSVCPCTLRLP